MSRPIPLFHTHFPRFFSDKVAAYKRLAGGVEFRPAIPKTASGKIQRRILKAEYLDKNKWARKWSTTAHEFGQRKLSRTNITQAPFTQHAKHKGHDANSGTIAKLLQRRVFTRAQQASNIKWLCENQLPHPVWMRPMGLHCGTLCERTRHLSIRLKSALLK